MFNQPLNALTNVDNILDFSVVDDTILLSHLVFTALGPVGTLPAGEFFTGSSAGDANDRIIYNSSTGVLNYDCRRHRRCCVCAVRTPDPRPRPDQL